MIDEFFESVERKISRFSARAPSASTNMASELLGFEGRLQATLNILEVPAGEVGLGTADSLVTGDDRTQEHSGLWKIVEDRRCHLKDPELGRVQPMPTGRRQRCQQARCGLLRPTIGPFHKSETEINLRDARADLQLLKPLPGLDEVGPR